MRKLVGWVIAIGLIWLLVYALTSGLPDVLDPFTPPGNPHP